MKRIGLLGGTFDPLHHGHIHLAISMLEIHHLDQVLFCPAALSPFKHSKLPTVSAQHRLSVVRYGIQHVPQFQVLDWEISGSGPSYTIDTVKRLSKESDSKLFLILGEDHIPHLHLWKDVEELCSLAAPLVGSRPSGHGTLNNLSPLLKSAVLKGLTPIPVLEISSTTVRERLKQKKLCSHLVPDLILDYIKQNGLYS